ncbi:MAG: Rho GTPase activation protein, partial [Piptocephalis tieghemiana]
PSIRPTAVLSLVGAKASKEDHPRRNHVFRVQTEDGAVYLLQAASSQDVREWISRVEEAANEANVRRRSLMDKMAGVGALKEGWEEGKGQDQEGQGEAKLPEVKAKVFGYPLDTLSLTPEGGISGEIPIVIEKCLQEIERRGLEEVGIYRISGTQSAMERLILAFEEDVGSVDLGDEMWSDINVVTGVLKQLLRSLPEPLMTYELYEGLIEAMRITEYNDRLFALKDLLAELPPLNYRIVRRLSEHLERITDLEDINCMYATNLAIVFGPTIMRPPPGPSNFSQAMANLGQHQNVVKNLILQYHWLFDVEEEGDAAEEGGAVGGEEAEREEE